MPFQFYCPQGHLLEGHESQAGQHGQCPICGSMFVMPGGVVPTATPVVPPGSYGGFQQPGYAPPGYPSPNPMAGYPAPAWAPQEAPGFPGFQQPASPFPEPPAAFAEPPPPEPEPPAPPPPEPEPEVPKVYRIPCPAGHVLETPEEMLGQQALCPYCNVQFELRREDSEEYKAEKAAKAAKRKAAFDKGLINWSIYLVIFVGLMLLCMVGYALFGTPK